jgi:hypothetical protein
MMLDGIDMLHLDYNWDLYHDKIILDDELNTDKLGWKANDFFKFVNIDGKQMLVKIDPLVAFTMGQSVNERTQNGHS